jgi:hypothetical protein
VARLSKTAPAKAARKAAPKAAAKKKTGRTVPRKSG